jgi:HemY protein
VLEAVVADALDERLARPDLTKDTLAEAWGFVPGELRSAPRLLALRAAALHRLGRGDEAEKELRAALKRNWHPALVAAYGDVRAADPQKQLRQAETWLKDHPEDGVLLLTAARLCTINELWGKARSYLESSLALAPDPGSYALYGRLLLQLGEREHAASAFRSGLSLASGIDFDVPALAGPALPATPDSSSATSEREPSQP